MYVLKVQYLTNRSITVGVSVFVPQVERLEVVNKRYVKVVFSSGKMPVDGVSFYAYDLLLLLFKTVVKLILFSKAFSFAYLMLLFKYIIY